MNNNKARTAIGCSLTPFDCGYYKPDNLCSQSSIDCPNAIKLKKPNPQRQTCITHKIPGPVYSSLTVFCKAKGLDYRYWQKKMPFEFEGAMVYRADWIYPGCA